MIVPADAAKKPGDRAIEAIYTVWRSCPNYGSEGCICGNHATPDRDCPVHWAVERLERCGFDYHQASAAMVEMVASTASDRGQAVASESDPS